MKIAKLLSACALGAWLVMSGAQASDKPVLDATSKEALFESSKAALGNLTLEEQSLFLTAVDVVSIYHTQDVLSEKSEGSSEALDLSVLSEEDGDRIINQTREMIHGKTIEEVIDLAASDEFLSARMAVGLMAERMRQQ